MASIKQRENGVWRARYRDETGKDHARHFRRRVDAQAWLDEQTAQLVRGEWVDPSAGKVRFATVADEWLATIVDRKPSTVATYESILNKNLRPAFGDRAVSSITTTSVRQFTASMFAEGAGFQTVKNNLNVLRAVLEAARESRYITSNPALGVKLPRTRARHARDERTASRVYLDAGQVLELAAVTPEPYDLLVTFAAFTGLRAGEVAGVEVRDVDLGARRLTVRRSVAEVHGALEVGPPKSGQSRTVPLPVFLVDRLRAYILATGYRDGDRLFRSPDGGPLRHSNFYRRVFRPAVTAAGLSDGLRFHDLRHTCASLLIAEGAHPKAVCEVLGHASIEITMDVYGHLYESAEDALADSLDRVHAEALADFSRTERGLRALPATGR